jgi:hypothetical protein
MRSIARSRKRRGGVWQWGAVKHGWAKPAVPALVTKAIPSKLALRGIPHEPRPTVEALLVPQLAEHPPAIVDLVLTVIAVGAAIVAIVKCECRDCNGR